MRGSPPKAVSPDKARVEGVINMGRDLCRRRDPVEVEISVSGLLGQLHERTGWDLEARESILRRMLDDAVDSGDRGGLAILHSLAGLLDEPLARTARAGVMRLRSAGVPDPGWVGSIGRYAFLGGWSAADELGDQELVVVEFAAEDGTGRHAVTFMVDANFDGLVRQASVASDAPRGPAPPDAGRVRCHVRCPPGVHEWRGSKRSDAGVVP